jgi:hypothetical protein
MRISHHAVDAERRQQQRRQGEHRQQPHAEPARRERVVEDLLDRAELSNRQLRIEPRDFAAHSVCQRQRIAGGPHGEMHPADPAAAAAGLQVRLVNMGEKLFIRRRLIHIADDAGDG